MDDFDQTKDLKKTRVLNLRDGNKINVKQKDPYGYWYLSYEKGTLPEVLKGAYTSYEAAAVAATAYLADKGRTPASITK